MLHSSESQREYSDAYHAEGEYPRSEASMNLQSLHLRQILKEFVYREAKTDQRSGRPNPRQKRSLLCEKCTLHAEAGIADFSPVAGVHRFGRVLCNRRLSPAWCIELLPLQEKFHNAAAKSNTVAVAKGQLRPCGALVVPLQSNRSGRIFR